jgi:hypothetical protein
MIMFQDFVSFTSIVSQQDFLITSACPMAPEPTGCTIGVLEWWKYIAKVIFSVQAASGICEQISEGACTGFYYQQQRYYNHIKKWVLFIFKKKIT